MSVVEKGRRGLVPLGLTGLAGIAVGLSASATVRLLGSTRGADTSDLALGIPVGAIIMAIIQVAMMGKLPYTALSDGTFTHPTLAEGLNYLFMTLDS